jgi:hypothetical protein
MKTLKMNVLAGILATLASGVASASPITTWTVGVDTTFDLSTVQPSVVWQINPLSLRWGGSSPTASGQSGLDITNSPASGTATLGVPLPDISITHYNQPIPAGTSLTSLTIDSTLTLAPNPFTPLSSVTIPFGVKFLETPNLATGQTCADGGISGAPGVNSNSCADIFVIDQSALNFDFTMDDPDYNSADPTSLVNIQNRQYYISFFEMTSGLNSLPTAACQAAAGVNACLGFETPEGANTTIQFAALITTAPVQIITVPEPGILGLLGLGLAAMGFALRRKA